MLLILQLRVCIVLCCAGCSVEFLCSVLAVAEQLLISRLKSICEVLIAQVGKYHRLSVSYHYTHSADHIHVLN